MKNRKKLSKGVVILIMVLGGGIAMLAPKHKAVASGDVTTQYGGWAYGNGPSLPATGCSCPWTPECECIIDKVSVN